MNWYKTAQQGRQLWEMTKAEIVDRGFPQKTRSISFENWAEQKGFKKGIDFASEPQFATFIGKSVFPEPGLTAAQAGKHKSLAKLVEHGNILQEQYVKEVPEIDTFVPATKPSQIRVLEKRHQRAIAQALSEGRSVPSEVLDDYPDIITASQKKKKKSKMVKPFLRSLPYA